MYSEIIGLSINPLSDSCIYLANSCMTLTLLVDSNSTPNAVNDENYCDLVKNTPEGWTLSLQTGWNFVPCWDEKTPERTWIFCEQFMCISTVIKGSEEELLSLGSQPANFPHFTRVSCKYLSSNVF